MMMFFKRPLKLLLYKTLPFFFPKKTDRPLRKDVGICMLVCHKDLSMLVYNLHSLFYELGFQLPIYIVNDGSLTVQDKKWLTESFFVTIENTTQTEKKMEKLLRPFPYLAAHRFAKGIGNYKLKLDVIFLSPFSRFIFMDADMLFLKKPIEIIYWIKNKEQKDYYSAHNSSFFNTSYFPEFTLRKLLYKHLHIKMNAGFSSGLLLVANKKVFNLNKIDKLFKLYTEISAINFDCLEENALSIITAKNQFECLPTDKYFVMSLWSEYQSAIKHLPPLIMMHFGWDTKVEFSKHAVRLALEKKFFQNIHTTI